MVEGLQAIYCGAEGERWVLVLAHSDASADGVVVRGHKMLCGRDIEDSGVQDDWVKLSLKI